jgi:hypothetical protein
MIEKGRKWEDKIYNRYNINKKGRSKKCAREYQIEVKKYNFLKNLFTALCSQERHILCTLEMTH